MKQFFFRDQAISYKLFFIYPKIKLKKKIQKRKIEMNVLEWCNLI